MPRFTDWPGSRISSTRIRSRPYPSLQFPCAAAIASRAHYVYKSLLEMAKEEELQKAFPILEETDENHKPTDVEVEEPQESSPLRPYDPEEIRVDPKTFSLRQILDMIDERDLELAPDFQRLRVWTPVQKSRLIESVLLRIPLPAFYFSSDPEGGLQVVDGLQRLSTIHDFVRGGQTKKEFFALNDLEYLQDQLGGKDFRALNSPLWTRRINTTQIIANVIDPQTPYRVKFDIFKRINTGGSPLTPQEIRHCLSKPQSRALLRKLTLNKAFIAATAGRLTGNVRMVDREVVLRFSAFRDHPGLENYSRYESMDDFLNTATQILDEASEDTVSQIEAEFENSMNNAYIIFGRHAFRKWPTYTDAVSPFNRALFDVWSVALVPYTQEQARLFRDRIVAKARRVMTDDIDFIASISAGTSDIRKVHTRFGKIQYLLREVFHARPT